jgi:TonB-dependent SusC/RagA subfamily outer membrane receptor
MACSYGYAASVPYSEETSIERVEFQQTVTGTVKNGATGEALSGVTIRVKGKDAAAQTDDAGNFSIAAENGDVLQVSFIGFTAQEFPVTSATANVVLTPDSESLDEVVVVGYGTQKRKEITSAVASVKEKDFNRGGMRNPMELVQGKVAGLNITRAQGSNPNSGTNIQLRGMASLKGTNSPLVVIDGIPGGSLDLIKQGDIESIDVLKDGSAAAIYGTRGNGGVILVTTKKGKAGKPQFEYLTYGQTEIVNRRPTMLDAAQFREKVVQGMNRPKLDLGATTDLYDELINKDNFSHFHNFIASGGGENSTYRASFNYEQAKGIAKENGRDQFGGRINFTQTGFNDKLTMSANIAANFNKANLLGGKKADDSENVPDFEQAVQRNPTAPIMNPDGTYYQTQEFNNYNPISRFAYRLDDRNQQTFSGDARLKYKIID